MNNPTNQMEAKEIILACPFCGCQSVNICRTNPRACWVECDTCNAQTSSAKTRKAAIANWNCRTGPMQASIIHDMDKESV